MSMPEEINRIVTDSLTDIFYTPSLSANENLRRAGIPEEKIVFVGNVMIDSLVDNIGRVEKPEICADFRLKPREYLVITMHRPATVDDPVHLKGLLDVICSQAKFPIVFPVHPRTHDKVKYLAGCYSNLVIVPPLSYLEFVYLVRDARGVISDSGGVSEETTYLNIPCITLRENTERPETLIQGTNRLVGHNHAAIREAMEDLIEGRWRQGTVPMKWDGRTAERIATHLKEIASA